jgi:hypothetical protein
MRGLPIPANKNQKPKTTPKTALANLASPKIEYASHVAPSALESAKQFGLQGAAIREALWETGWCPNLNRPGEKAERANQLLPGLILLQTVPHARAGDETLRFDFAASQAIPPADKPSGTPLLLGVNERYLGLCENA